MKLPEANALVDPRAHGDSLVKNEGSIEAVCGPIGAETSRANDSLVKNEGSIEAKGSTSATTAIKQATPS